MAKIPHKKNLPMKLALSAPVTALWWREGLFQLMGLCLGVVFMLLVMLPAVLFSGFISRGLGWGQPLFMIAFTLVMCVLGARLFGRIRLPEGKQQLCLEESGVFLYRRTTGSAKFPRDERSYTYLSQVTAVKRGWFHIQVWGIGSCAAHHHNQTLKQVSWEETLLGLQDEAPRPVQLHIDRIYSPGKERAIMAALNGLN